VLLHGRVHSLGSPEEVADQLAGAYLGASR